MLAEAIRDPDLCTLLSEVERALNADDATSDARLRADPFWAFRTVGI